MGTRYYLTVNCPHCKSKNKNVYFVPTSGMGSHKCTTCQKRFWIGDDFSGHKEPPKIDMRKHSTWGEDWTERTGIPAFQTLDQ